jgi:hypothetical protein
MTARRAGSVLFLALAAISGAPAPAQDAAPTYFSVATQGWDQRVAAGPDGSVYVAGTTANADAPEPPSEPGWYHAFVSARAADGTIRWTRYLPYGPGYGEPTVRAVRAAADGSVWVAWTAATSTYPNDDVGVARLAGDGSILVSERFGGSRHDRPAGLVVTADGDAIVAGTTLSPDFPVTVPSLWAERESAAFVVRVRADGSGVAWSRLLESSANGRCTALAAGGSGDVLAAVAVSTDPAYLSEPFDLNGSPSLLDLGVTRMSEDGDVTGTTPLPHSYGGVVHSLAALADGSVLAAGRMTYPTYDRNGGNIGDAFVMRVRPETGVASALWKERGWLPARIAVEPSGDVLVGTDLHYVNPYYGSYPYTENVSRVRRLTPDLCETATLLDRDGLRAVEDFVVAPDGALCAAGRGLAVTFNPSVQPGVYASFVARIPPAGVAPAASVEAVRTTRDAVELSWTGGDPTASYEVEQLLGPPYDMILFYTVAAGADGSAHGVVVGGLEPGMSYQFRVVSVFPSGVRSAARPFVAHTKPPRPSNFTARETRRGVLLQWSPESPGTNARMELERRIGGGPWRRVTRSPWFDRDLTNSWGSFVDGLPPLGAGSVMYRLRAALVDGHGASAWTCSNTLPVSRPALHVRQASGRVQAGWCSGGVGYIDYEPPGPPRYFEVAGTFSAAADEVVPPFDPTRYDLHIWFGDAGAPIGVEARANSWWWTRERDGWVWADYGDNGTRWRVTIDPVACTFDVRGCIDDAGDFRRNADSVVVGISYGNWSGGEIRRWDRLPGPRPNLVLR